MRIKKPSHPDDLYSISTTVLDLLHNKSVEESYDYIKNFKHDVMFIETGWWDITLKKIKTKGLCLEFGVFEGNSINYFSNFLPKIKFYGFDSFEGNQEDWLGGSNIKGFYNLNGKLPKVNKNVILVKGWFKDSLSKFLKSNNEKISFMHIDCSTYESTKDVFSSIPKDRLQKGCLILFDEYFGYVGWKTNEFKAWQEYVLENKIKYKYVLFSHKQALIEIL